MQKLGYLGGEKLGRPILSPTWLVKESAIPCQEYANNLCFLGGGEKLGRPILSPPWLLIHDKMKHQPCADGYLGGEKLSRPILSPTWLVKELAIPCQEYANNLCFLGGGEKLGRPILSPPWLLIHDKIKHQPCADGYLGGEKLGRPILSPPRLVKTSTITCHEYANNLCFLGGGEKLGRPINFTLSWIHIPPLLIRGWGKTRSAQSLPTLTSESINLVQKLGYLGGEKLGRPILSPPGLVKVSTLPCHEYANNLCFLGGGENWAGPFFPHPD